MVSLPFPVIFFCLYWFSGDSEEYLQRISLNVSKDSAFYLFDYCIVLLLDNNLSCSVSGQDLVYCSMGATGPYVILYSGFSSSDPEIYF